MQKFEYEDTGIEGLKIIKPIIAEDKRGYFLKSYEKDCLEQIGITLEVSEINESKSKKGVLRGLHFQKRFPQAKLIRAEQGEIFDVAVDLRMGSPTYGQWRGVYLSAENRSMYFLPKGFAHGFLTVSDFAVITYTCDGKYRPDDEGGIAWDDPVVGVNWPADRVSQIILSEKDCAWGSFEAFTAYGGA